jgi:hypothetical protein
MSSHMLFFFILHIMFGIPSIFIDEVFLSLYTNEINDGKSFVGKYHYKIPTKKIVGNFVCIF